MPMKVYEITFEKDFKVSLVKNPALEMTMVKFSEEIETPLYFTNEEKREIFSVAMSPDKLIYRNNIQGEPANVFYTAETIEKFQQNYFRTNANKGTNIDHAEFNTEGVFPFESWIVANPDNDKSSELGLVTKKGDLVMGFKVDNDEVWKQCKEGNLDGLSIEGKVLFREVNNNINIQMNKQKENLLTKIVALFSAEPLEEVVEMAVEVKKEEEAPIEDAPKEEEEDLVEAAVENVPIAQEVAEDTTAPDAVDWEAKVNALEEENAKLKADLATIQAEKIKAEEDLVTMSKQTPAAEAIVDLPKEVKKEYAQMSNYEKLKFNKENKK
jgi:hypothetical protein